MDPSPPDLTGIPGPGGVVAGKYQIEQTLGAGGMGVVVAARHLVLGQPVAIKFLLPAAARLPEASSRFLREAKAAASITSEHVARVLDMGTLETGAPYMVMEYLAGADLGRLVKARGPLPPAEAVDLVLQACEAIAEAHALGIVHRDLKLGNLFVTARADGSPLVKVLDFGLSKTMADGGASESSLTATGVILGSPYYMSPEQIRSLKTVDARTDIWALGVILYVMLSARRPFGGETASAICASVAADFPAPLVSVRADLPPALDAVIGRCLEKDMVRRFQSVAELACALAPFGSARAALSVERIVRVLPGAAVAASAALPAPGPSAGPFGAPTQSVPLTAPPAQAAPFAIDPRSVPGAQSAIGGNESQSVPLAGHSQSIPLASHSQSVPLASHSQSVPLASALVPKAERSVAGVSWGQAAAEPLPSRRGALAAAVAAGVVLGGVALAAAVWLGTSSPAQPAAVTLGAAAQPQPAASAPAAAPRGSEPHEVAEPPPAPTTSPSPAEPSSASSAAPPSRSSAAKATAAPRRTAGGRKPSDSLLDRWK